MPLLSHHQQSSSIAAVDLGSNALRSIIVKPHLDGIVTLRNIREPLRLGEDVFAHGIIGEKKFKETEEAFIKLFHTFMSYNVQEVRAVATSAMRDALNGLELKKIIEKTTGIEIKVISGKEEASLIASAVGFEVNLKKKNALLMDIGGGSTELTIIEDGDVVASQSFNVGTVRLLGYHSISELEKNISREIKYMIAFLKDHISIPSIDHFIGTGGNLRRIGKIRRKLLKKSSSTEASLSEILRIQEALKSMSFIDRVRRLELDYNRADVILPAIMITFELMDKLKQDKLLMPKVGLKEGLILSMFDEKPHFFKIKD